MGQYHYIVNLTKREYIHPHKLGHGLKLLEQIDSVGGPPTALFILLACSNGRGGGDFNNLDTPSAKYIGRWAGDQIAIVGDYAERTDLPSEFNADILYNLCNSPKGVEDQIAFYYENSKDIDKAERLARSKLEPYIDITDELIPLMEEICRVKYEGDRWKEIRILDPQHTI